MCQMAGLAPFSQLPCAAVQFPESGDAGIGAEGGDISIADASCHVTEHSLCRSAVTDQQNLFSGIFRSDPFQSSGDPFLEIGKIFAAGYDNAVFRRFEP